MFLRVLVVAHLVSCFIKKNYEGMSSFVTINSCKSLNILLDKDSFIFLASFCLSVSRYTMAPMKDCFL